MLIILKYWYQYWSADFGSRDGSSDVAVKLHCAVVSGTSVTVCTKYSTVLTTVLCCDLDPCVRIRLYLVAVMHIHMAMRGHDSYMCVFTSWTSVTTGIFSTNKVDFKYRFRSCLVTSSHGTRQLVFYNMFKTTKRLPPPATRDQLRRSQAVSSARPSECGRQGCHRSGRVQ